VTEPTCKASDCDAAATERRGVCRFHKHARLQASSGTRRASPSARRSSPSEPSVGVPGYSEEQLDELWERLNG
jgi:hypothetical protein